MNNLNDLLAKTRKQESIIAELLDKNNRLHRSIAELERSSLTISGVIKCNMEHKEQMMVLGTYRTENGIVIHVAG